MVDAFGQSAVWLELHVVSFDYLSPINLCLQRLRLYSCVVHAPFVLKLDLDGLLRLLSRARDVVLAPLLIRQHQFRTDHVWRDDRSVEQAFLVASHHFGSLCLDVKLSSDLRR